jgi:fucose permease
MGKRENSRFLLFAIVYGTMAIYGFIENLKGVTYPLIKTEFAVSYDRQGLMVSMVSFAYVLFGAAGSILIARFGVKRALTAGFATMLAALGAVFVTPNYHSAVLALVATGAAFGFFDVGVNALGTQIFTRKAALLMNVLHCFYGLGSTLSPRMAGAVSAGLGWRYSYLLPIPALLLVFIPTLTARFPDQETPREDPGGPAKPGPGGFTGALRDPMVWLFSLTLGLLVVVEVGTANWGGLYFLDVYGVDPAGSGANLLSVFFICFTLSRLLSGFLIEKAGYIRSLLGASLASLAVLGLGFALGGRGLYVIPFLGLFVAIFWPTTIAVAMGYFGRRAPVTTSVMIVIAGVLGGGAQLLIGLTNRLFGPAWGYRSCLGYGILAFAALLALRRGIRNRPPSHRAKV